MYDNDAYWYHPDRLSSSSYITNLAGEITQHMEYLPFGETLVEEHLNSYTNPINLMLKSLMRKQATIIMAHAIIIRNGVFG